MPSNIFIVVKMKLTPGNSPDICDEKELDINPTSYLSSLRYNSIKNLKTLEFRRNDYEKSDIQSK